MIHTRYQDFLISENKKDKFPSSLEDYRIIDYKIREDGYIDVYQDIGLDNCSFRMIPFKFGKVEGEFYVSYTNISSLRNSPRIVTGNFVFTGNMVSFSNGPKEVGSFKCHDCPKLTSLIHLPLIHNNLEITGAKKLTSLKYCPSIINGNFTIRGAITSLEFGPKKVMGDYEILGNDQLLNFDHCAKYIGGDFDCTRCDNENINSEYLDEYPVSIIEGHIFNKQHHKNITNRCYQEACEIIKGNREKFEPLLDNKLAFHQQIMRINPDMVKYFRKTPMPSVKTII